MFETNKEEKAIYRSSNKEKDDIVDEIVNLNDRLRFKLNKRYPKVKFNHGTTLEIAKDIILNKRRES